MLRLASLMRLVVAALAAAVLMCGLSGDLSAQAKTKGKAKPKTSQQASKKPKKSGAGATAAKSIDNIRKQKSETEQRISQTAGELDRTGRELSRQLNQLNSLNADITTSKARVDSLRLHIAGIGQSINSAADSIRLCEARLEELRQAYAETMRRLQPYADRTSAASFILSSPSFIDAWRRVRYVRQFAAWRRAKAEAITATIDEIAARRSHLTSLRHQQDLAYREADEGRRRLESQQAESEKMVASLRKNEAALRQNLAQQRKQAQALDSELDRLIEAEQKRIAEQQRRDARQQRQTEDRRLAGSQAPKTAGPSTSKTQGGKSETPPSAPSQQNVASASKQYAQLTGTFAQNKGRMPFPVEGSYKIVRRFGRQPHPTLPHVETDNSGIDIETRPQANVRAIFSGTVSAIFKQDGFNSIVMLRHGSYITVYAGLGTVAVKTGQTVSSGQTLGTVFSPPSDSPLLHFEIRKEREKLNPTAWVK